MSVYYPSEMKYKRAQEAVAKYKIMAAKKPGLVDYKLVAEGLAAGLKDEALIDYIYEGLGGLAKVTGPQAVEAEKKSVEAKKRTRQLRDKDVEREKVTVKRHG